jgi:hypothetical protein
LEDANTFIFVEYRTDQKSASLIVVLDIRVLVESLVEVGVLDVKHFFILSDVPGDALTHRKPECDLGSFSDFGPNLIFGVVYYKA